MARRTHRVHVTGGLRRANVYERRSVEVTCTLCVRLAKELSPSNPVLSGEFQQQDALTEINDQIDRARGPLDMNSPYYDRNHPEHQQARDKMFALLQKKDQILAAQAKKEPKLKI